MYKAKKTFLFLVSSAVMFITYSGSYAQVNQPGSLATIPNPLGKGNDTIMAFIKLLLDTLFPIASLVAVFFLIYSGFLMVTAGGNEEKLSKARQAFLWTVIGVAILLGAKVLSAVICGTINQLSTSTITCDVNN